MPIATLNPDEKCGPNTDAKLESRFDLFDHIGNGSGVFDAERSVIQSAKPGKRRGAAGQRIPLAPG